MKEGPENHACAWSPLPSQVTVRVAKRRTTQTCCRADGPCVCMCESLMKVKHPRSTIACKNISKTKMFMPNFINMNRF